MIHTCVQNRHSDSYSFLYQKSIVTFGVNELTEAEDWILAFQQLLNRIQQVQKCTVGKIQPIVLSQNLSYFSASKAEECLTTNFPASANDRSFALAGRFVGCYYKNFFAKIFVASTRDRTRDLSRHRREL